MTVCLGERLKIIGESAYQLCTSLHEIAISSFVRVIHRFALSRCSNLTAVSLGEGLGEICHRAFYECSSLREIAIPSRVRANDSAFSDEVRIILSEVVEGQITRIKCTNSSCANRYYWFTPHNYISTKQCYIE